MTKATLLGITSHSMMNLWQIVQFVMKCK